MKELNYQKYQEKVYYEELDNGLKVYIIHKPGFKTSTCALGTPYGALDIHQKGDGKTFDFHPGIAHFLEHKVFEDDKGDVMERFMQMGASVNAFTSYHETVYYFSLSKEEQFANCLNLLLDFVQSFKIDEASVEKEKPIIVEEVKMYEQYPETRLLNGAMKAMYHQYPLKYDIGGDEESVNSISLKELEECYGYNYHPSNMALVITSFIEPSIIMDIVKTNQSSKSFKPFTKLELNNPYEPGDCALNSLDINMPVLANKVLMGIKLNYNNLSYKEIVKREFALRMAYSSIFTSLNPDYQKWLDEKLINDFFGFEVELTTDASYIIFYGENMSKDQLSDLVFDNLKDVNLDEAKIEQLKRRYIGELLANMDDTNSYTMFFIKAILDDLNVFDMIDILNDIDIDYVRRVLNEVDYKNSVMVNLTNNVE